MVSSYSELEQSLRSSGGEPDGSDFVRVATELADVLLHPFERMGDVPDSHIGGTSFVEECWTIVETGHSKSVIVGDEDKVGAQVKRPSGVFCDLPPPVKPPPYVHTITGSFLPSEFAGAYTSRKRQSSSDEQSTSASASVPMLISVSTSGHRGLA